MCESDCKNTTNTNTTTATMLSPPTATIFATNDAAFFVDNLQFIELGKLASSNKHDVNETTNYEIVYRMEVQANRTGT